MAALTQNEVSRLRDTIASARGGRASLTELASAHEIAERAGLPGCAAELRSHIRAVAADHHAPDQWNIGRDVATGVVSGVITTLLLGAL